MKFGLRKLAEMIEQVEKPELSVTVKYSLRHRLLEHIVEEGYDYDQVSNVVNHLQYQREFQFDAVKKDLMKERIMNSIAESQEFSAKSIFSFFSFASFQKAVSMGLIFVMVFSLVSFRATDTNIVMADSFTKLDSFNGEIYLKRGGDFIEVKKGMELLESDKIITPKDSTAVVEFFDESVSRLAGDTEVVFERLDFSGDLSRYVEIALIEGKLWTRVINVIDEDAFVIHTENISTSAKKAAFDVEVKKNEKTEVKVYNSSVDIKKKNSEDKDKVLSGQKVVAIEEEIVVDVISKEEKEVAWVQENMKEDQAFVHKVEEKVVIARKESLENEKIQNKALLTMSFNDVEKKKNDLEVAEKKFIEAELKLRDENLTEEEVKKQEDVINDFYDEVENFYAFVETVKIKDEKYANDLKTFVKDKVKKQKKDLALVLPDSKAYVAKETIDQIAFINAESNEEADEIKVDKAISKISEVEAIIEKGNVEKAAELIDKNKVEIKESLELIESKKNNVDSKNNEVSSKVVQDANKYLDELEVSVKSTSKTVVADESKDDTDKETSVTSSETGTKVLTEDTTTNTTSTTTTTNSIKTTTTTTDKTSNIVEPVVEEGDFGVKIQDGKILPGELF